MKKLSFLLFTLTLMIFACGKKNTAGKYTYCPRRLYEITNCRRMYVGIYGEPYTNEMCNRYGMTVACN